MTSILDSMLADAVLSIAFQPIFDVTVLQPEVWAMEALTRGPAGTHFESAAVLFDYVRLRRDEMRVDRHCCRMAIAASAGLAGAPVVTINAHASTLERDQSFPEFLLAACESARLPPSKLVVEIVEHVPYLDARRLRASLAVLRSAGVRIAVDDLGFGHGNLRVFLDVRPEYVKIERYFVESCSTDPDRRTLLRGICAVARDFGAMVIAEGVEHPDDLEVLREIEIPFAQGFLLGRPVLQFDAGHDHRQPSDKEQTCNERRFSVSTTPRPS